MAPAVVAKAVIFLQIAIAVILKTILKNKNNIIYYTVSVGYISTSSLSSLFHSDIFFLS